MTIEWHAFPRGVSGTDGDGIIASVQRGSADDLHIKLTVYLPEDTSFEEAVLAVETAVQTLRNNLGMS